MRRNRAFRFLWFGELVSLTGDWFTTIALFAMLLELTGRGEAIGFALVARFLPSLLFGPATGVIADRYSRRAILVTCDVLRAVIVLGFLLVRDAGDVWLVYLLTFAQLTLTAQFETAELAAIGSVVSREQIVAANSLQGMTWSAMLAAGALIGGVVTALVGRQWAFILNALTFLMSAYFVSRAAIPLLEARPRVEGWLHAVGFHEAKEGLAYVFGSPARRQAIFAKAAWGLAGGAALMLYGVFGERVHRLGTSIAGGIGALYAARGVGALLGPYLARLAGDDKEATLVRWIGYSFGVMAVAYLGFALAPSLLWASVALIAAHMGVSTSWTFSTALVNLRVGDELRGRAFAADMALFTATTIVSILVAGRLLDHHQLRPQTIMLGVAVALGGMGLLWTWLARRVPAADEPAPPPSDILIRRPPDAGGEV